MSVYKIHHLNVNWAVNIYVQKKFLWFKWWWNLYKGMDFSIAYNLIKEHHYSVPWYHVYPTNTTPIVINTYEGEPNPCAFL